MQELEMYLDVYVKEYYLAKAEVDKYTKIANEYNEQIKETMKHLNITEFESTNGLIAKIIIQNREKFNDAKLIDKLKTLGVNEAIKTVEVVDMDALEDSIYNGRLDAANISDCRETTKVTTLKINKKKGV